MSRIYDALKRAEHEATSPQQEAEGRAGSVDSLFQPTIMVDQATVPRGDAPIPGDPATMFAEAANPTQSPVRLSSATRAGEESVDLLDRLPICKWSPSAKCEFFTDRQRSSSVSAEQFRRLRSRLYQMRDKHSLKRVLVSSAISGEGKTLICANLASALARHGRSRVLLIDGDLRKPSLHSELGASAAPGLSDYLLGDLDELAVIQRGPLDNLFFISGGTASADPADMVSSGRLQQLMQRASELFDWVILDSSPVIPISDATVLARYCDGVLLVVKAQTTPFDLAQKAKEEFRNSVLLGVVLNQVAEISSYKPYYYAYKGPAPSSVPSGTTV